MAGWSVEATFFLLAAAIQLSLGLTIVLRRAGVEWALVLGTLFCLNGALSMNGLLVHLGVYAGGVPGDGFVHPGSRIVFVFDRLTTLLIGYLALAYPRRPRWAAHRPLLLPTVFAVLALSVVVPFWLGAGYCRSLFIVCDAPSPFASWTLEALSLGVPLLLVRWAYLLPRSDSPLALTHLKLLLGVFALRMVHVELTFQMPPPEFFQSPAEHHWITSLSPRLFRSLASTGALTAFVAILLRARRREPSDVGRAVDIVLAFAMVGAAEAALTMTLDVLRGGFPYFYGPLLQLDLVIARPAVVLYAIMRHDLLGPFFLGQRIKLAVSATLALLMAFAAVAVPLANTEAPSIAAYTAAILLAIVLAAAAVAWLRPFLASARRGPGMASATAVAAYIASLEEAYRNDQPTPADRARLAEDRRRLGVTDSQAQVLETAVRSRWAGTVGDMDWTPGQTLAGRYRIESLLGEGGMAETYEATDLIEDRRVVLKRTRRLDGPSRKALVREAFHLARLEHPNIVRLLRTEQSGEEHVLVLEFLQGGSLDQRLAKGPLGARAATRLAADVLRGLRAAHRAGVLHRDLKPSNILFSEDGSAKLADFGIARSNELPQPLVDHTVTDRLPCGSLRYMSPEQVQGRLPDERSDLFSLGLVLAEALGGEPLPGTPATDYEVRRAIVDGPAPRLRPGVPKRLASAIRAATDRDAGRRPPSAAHMLSMLD